MTKIDVPFDKTVVDAVLAEKKLNPCSATIRKISMIVSEIEHRLSCRYLRMEFGVPGIEPHPLAIEAEISALRKPRIAGAYAPLTGVPFLKQEASLFVKNFLNLEIPSDYIVPTVGSMHGVFLAIAIAGRTNPSKNKILFVDPSFAVYRSQIRFLGLEEKSVDIYDREQLIHNISQACKDHDVAAIVYASPANPTWNVLTEEEVKALADICNQQDIIVIEDLAYFGMDFRVDYSVPGQPPYPTTAARYTDHCVILLSSSKIFSYAGQRIGLCVVSPKLAVREFEGLQQRFSHKVFFDALVWDGLYCTTAGVAHSSQYALATLLSKVNRGQFNFLRLVQVYSERAKVLRRIFRENGFVEVYKSDGSQPLADGFFFTLSYPGMTGGQLIQELLYYGISATTLSISSSSRSEGIRACTSLIGENDYDLFETRIKCFHKDH